MTVCKISYLDVVKCSYSFSDSEAVLFSTWAQEGLHIFHSTWEIHTGVLSLHPCYAFICTKSRDHQQGKNDAWFSAEWKCPDCEKDAKKYLQIILYIKIWFISKALKWKKLNGSHFSRKSFLIWIFFLFLWNGGLYKYPLTGVFKSTPRQLYI